jgi:hypothetical protein
MAICSDKWLKQQKFRAYADLVNSQITSARLAT